jgi:polyisoprenyl-teichoic acid--peptidoglycan teichoic acid transferase
MRNIDSAGGNRPKPPLIKISSEPLPKQSAKLPKVKSKTGPKKILKKILIVVILIIVGLASAVAIRADNLAQKIFVGQKTTFFEKVADLIRGGGDNEQLIGENLGQINVLLLGIGGEGHDGPYLTDTMIVAQIRPDIGEVALISIPRDYWTQMPCGTDQEKINAAFSEGYLANHDWNQAGQCAIQAAETLTGLQIPYFAELDFSGFQTAIDQVGGVDLTVDRTFTDYAYPNDATNGYLPPLTFTAGPQHMDGATALEFARSRHAEGPEGSDFARSQRQQKIIEAFKAKVLSLNLITNAVTLNSLLSTFADHFHTNLSPGEILHVYDLMQQGQIKDFISLSLDPTTSLICPQTMADTGAYILTLCPGKTALDIENFFKNVFANGKTIREKAIVWLSDPTANTADYNTAYNELTQAGITVYQFDYKGPAPSENIFYEANPKPNTAEFIKNTLNATQATLPPPGITIDPSKVDVIVILGNNNSN